MGVEAPRSSGDGAVTPALALPSRGRESLPSDATRRKALPCSPPPCGEELEVGVEAPRSSGDGAGTPTLALPSRGRGIKCFPRTRRDGKRCPALLPLAGRSWRWGCEAPRSSGDGAGTPPASRESLPSDATRRKALPCSPPPCGEELEVGVEAPRSSGDGAGTPALALPSRGRESAACCSRRRTTCIVKVDPPDTMRPLRRNCPPARKSATASTPEWSSKRLSS